MKSLLGRLAWHLGLAALILSAGLGGCSSNNLPVINDLEAGRDSVVISGSLEVKCVAFDPDGDNLVYAWSATGGTISGAGPVITWQAPATPGAYAVTALVTDGRGGEASQRLSINVQGNSPPLIRSLTAASSTVRRGEYTSIECLADDPDGDGLSYLWTADRGTISGQGSSITWTAPTACGSYVVRVSVTDGRGGESRGWLDIRVVKPG